LLDVLGGRRAAPASQVFLHDNRSSNRKAINYGNNKKIAINIAIFSVLIIERVSARMTGFMRTGMGRVIFASSHP
jgi:hypothetical protein